MEGMEMRRIAAFLVCWVMLLSYGSRAQTSATRFYEDIGQLYVRIVDIDLTKAELVAQFMPPPTQHFAHVNNELDSEQITYTIALDGLLRSNFGVYHDQSLDYLNPAQFLAFWSKNKIQGWKLLYFTSDKTIFEIIQVTQQYSDEWVSEDYWRGMQMRKGSVKKIEKGVAHCAWNGKEHVFVTAKNLKIVDASSPEKIRTLSPRDIEKSCSCYQWLITYDISEIIVSICRQKLRQHSKTCPEANKIIGSNK